MPKPASTPTSITARTASDHQLAHNNAAVSEKINELFTRMNDGDEEAMQEFIDIGESAIEPLIKALRDGNRDVRVSAASVLGKIGDKRAVEPLIKVLDDEITSVSRDAKDALGKIEGADEAVADFIFRNPDSLKEHGVTLEELAEQCGWKSVGEIVGQAKREEELRERLGKKITEITDTIKDKLAELAEAYYSVIADAKDQAYLKELDELIEEYRQIFKKTVLKT